MCQQSQSQVLTYQIIIHLVEQYVPNIKMNYITFWKIWKNFLLKWINRSWDCLIVIPVGLMTFSSLMSEGMVTHQEMDIIP